VPAHKVKMLRPPLRMPSSAESLPVPSPSYRLASSSEDAPTITPALRPWPHSESRGVVEGCRADSDPCCSPRVRPQAATICGPAPHRLGPARRALGPFGRPMQGVGCRGGGPGPGWRRHAAGFGGKAAPWVWLTRRRSCASPLGSFPCLPAARHRPQRPNGSSPASEVRDTSESGISRSRPGPLSIPAVPSPLRVHEAHACTYQATPGRALPPLRASDQRRRRPPASWRAPGGSVGGPGSYSPGEAARQPPPELAGPSTLKAVKSLAVAGPAGVGRPAWLNAWPAETGVLGAQGHARWVV
jgi:hypothetical protein